MLHIYAHTNNTPAPGIQPGRTCRVGASIVPGACHVGARGLGMLGSEIKAATAIGEHGPGLMFNDGLDDNREYRLVVRNSTFPAGALIIEEDGSVDYTAAGTAVYDLYESGELVPDGPWGISAGFSFAVAPVGIASGVAFGAASVSGPQASVIGAGGMASGVSFGVPTIGLIRSVTGAGGIASTSALGVPNASRVYAVTDTGGIPSSAAVGVPSLSISAQVSGAGAVQSQAVFGVPILSATFVVAPGPTPTQPAAKLSGWGADSVLAGMTPAQVAEALSTAQGAYVQLMTGTKVVTASYAQGDGSRSVSYTAANIADLAAFIRLCQASLGMMSRPRRPVRFNFR
jgi:hypothetical protein